MILDESGEEKKGIESVGVGHQYCGNLEKRCNSQVAVYATLSSDNLVNIIDTGLYLPADWVEDKAISKKAGIPVADQVFKTKTELALDSIKSQKKGWYSF